ncbi:extensin family protein [Aureimonas sp. ME7]|uniref:extensin-like domain-containing protein n=1 Tax=Aureimonas sp. ME7 TaxID=2744252 RepID=UPI0015F659E0|nr:extensin family protein [Aureimonas sp. ME7]
MRGRKVWIAAAVSLLAYGARAEEAVPVPRTSPEAEAPTAGEPPPPVHVPVPEDRPEPPAGETATPSPEAKPSETPADGKPAEEKPAELAPATSPSADAPQPAYVPPEKARTQPEPSAPETPPMEVTPAQTVEAAAAVEDAVMCEKELKARGAEFTVGETIADGYCGVLRPVSVKRLSNGTTVEPGTTFLCRTALALDIWVGESVEPSAKAEFKGAKVKALSQASTYVCRARASESRISEHSRGSAIDIAGFVLSDGRTVPVEAVTPGTPEDRFAAAVRRAACGPFRTVLGPGTDSDHGTHLHLDIAARSNDATYCR